MGSPPKITIDLTVVRDYLDEHEERHSSATELFELAGNGKFDLALAPQGQRTDVDGDLADQIEKLKVDEGIEELPQLSYVSAVTYPSDDLYPGQYVEGFGEHWEAVVTGGKRAPGIADRMHVETHIYFERDVFITDDRRLRDACDRLEDEYGYTIRATGIEEFMATLRDDSATNDR